MFLLRTEGFRPAIAGSAQPSTCAAPAGESLPKFKLEDLSFVLPSLHLLWPSLGKLSDKAVYQQEVGFYFPLAQSVACCICCYFECVSFLIVVYILTLFSSSLSLFSLCPAVGYAFFSSISINCVAWL